MEADKKELGMNKILWDAEIRWGLRVIQIRTLQCRLWRCKEKTGGKR